MAVTSSFLQIVDQHADYPENLPPPTDCRRYRLQSLAQRLEERGKYLFLKKGPAKVHLLEARDASEDVNEHCAANLESLKRYLSTPDTQQYRQDPSCRMIFLSAKTQQSRLDVHQDMFYFIMSYLQVMPSFLEFVYPFGWQETSHDPHAGGLHSNFHLTGLLGTSELQAMRRSGCQLELSYTLRSPERTREEAAPWSVRQTSVWHSFDLIEERQGWVIIKANDTIEKAMSERLKGCPSSSDDSNHLLRALRLSLAAHLDICHWSVTNWSWYLTEQEQNVRTGTKKAVVANLGNLTAQASIPAEPASPNRERPVNRPEKASQARQWLSWLLHGCMSDSVPVEDEEMGQIVLPRASLGKPKFSFEDLQKMQQKEEVANSAIVVLKLNVEVVKQLRQEYHRLQVHEVQAIALGPEALVQINEFEEELLKLEAHFRVLQVRAETLLKQVQDGRNLLYAILQNENMRHTFEVSREAKDSAMRMEEMNRNMHKVAVNTHAETIRMRVITVVTLVFLPGTFVSTLMSTQLIKFPDPGQGTTLGDATIGTGALQAYVVMSVPLMLLTLFFSWIMHRTENKHPSLPDEKKSSK